MLLPDRQAEVASILEETLLRFYPNGSIGAFMAEYFEMAFKGREEAAEFEKATAAIFQDVFGFSARHVGPIGLTPDVLILSDSEGYSAIIDNKAYSKYSISNDHHNRMVHNYIGNLGNYYSGPYPLAFFSYIAGGFGANIERQLQAITGETGVKGKRHARVQHDRIDQAARRSQLQPLALKGDILHRKASAAFRH